MSDAGRARAARDRGGRLGGANAATGGKLANNAKASASTARIGVDERQAAQILNMLTETLQTFHLIKALFVLHWI